MKRVSAYQATDGTLFDDKKACAAHQRALNISEGVHKIAENMNGNPFYMCDDLGHDAFAIVDSFQLAHFILTNAEAIKRALDGESIEVAAVDDFGTTVTTVADVTPEEAFITAA